MPDELQSPVSVTGAGAVAVFQNPFSAHSVGSNSQSANNGDFGLSYNEQYNSPEDSLMRFRNLNEIYENTSEIDLIEDSDVEAMLAIMEEPTCYREAAGDENWEATMRSELQSITRNKTWELVKLPSGQRPIGLMWVFKLKKNAEGEIVKYKARLVAKGYVQKQGIDFEEFFCISC